MHLKEKMKTYIMGFMWMLQNSHWILLFEIYQLQDPFQKIRKPHIWHDDYSVYKNILTQSRTADTINLQSDQDNCFHI